MGFVSLGCVKNLVDSERMLADIAQSGALITADEQAADVIVVNTCGFLDAARQEALDVFRGLAERRRAGTLKRLIAVGCLVQRDGQALLDLVPELNALVGVHNRDDVVSAVWGRAAGVTPAKSTSPETPSQSPTLGRDVDLYLGDYHPQPWSDQVRLRLTPPHYAYVRISEGCDQKCTFCTIPSIRGPLRSKSVEAILAECRELIADGARELILIGQDTTSYGRDIGYAPGLAGLLRELDRGCDGARWLRLMYAYPSVLTDEMIAALAECERVVKYVDIPLQHISDRVLRMMGRRVTRARTERLLARLREQMPGVTIRTTLIVGFPGETDADFEEQLDFVRSFRFDALGAFPFSLEPETPSAKLPDRVPDELIMERHERLMLTQQGVAIAQAEARRGSRFEVLVDGPNVHGELLARHAGQAPDVDSVCLMPADTVAAGSFVKVCCRGARDYDLVVERLSERR